MDPIADMLTIIRNGYMANLKEVSCPKSRLRTAIAQVLAKNHFIKSVSEEDNRLKIKLAYNSDKSPAITVIKRVSKPGLRVYCNVSQLKKQRLKHAIKIISTSKGIMTDREAIAQNLGGEVIALVY